MSGWGLGREVVGGWVGAFAGIGVRVGGVVGFGAVVVRAAAAAVVVEPGGRFLCYK